MYSVEPGDPFFASDVVKVAWEQRWGFGMWVCVQVTSLGDSTQVGPATTRVKSGTEAGLRGGAGGKRLEVDILS